MKIRNLDDAEAFCEVAKYQSFSRAAKSLRVPLSMVSKRIARLEETLGTRLLHRSTRSMHLTEEGTRLYAHLQRLFSDINEVEEDIVRSATPQGIVRMTVPITLAKAPFAKIIASFSQQYPKVKVNVHVSDDIQSLVDGGFDLAIRITNLQDSSCIMKKIGTNCLKLVCSPAYAKKYGLPKNVKDMKDHNLFVITAHKDRKFLKSGKTLGELSVDSVVHTNNGQFTLEMAKLGMGITVRSHWDVAEEIKNKKLIEIKLNEELEMGSSVYIITPSNQYVSTRVRLLIDTLTRELPAYFDGKVDRIKSSDIV